MNRVKRSKEIIKGFPKTKDGVYGLKTVKRSERRRKIQKGYEERSKEGFQLRKEEINFTGTSKIIE